MCRAVEPGEINLLTARSQNVNTVISLDTNVSGDSGAGANISVLSTNLTLRKWRVCEDQGT
jgi:hypothetical protein